jgi:hypothetical protein
VLDQRPQVFAGEPTNLHAPTRHLFVELQPVGEVSDPRVEEPKQAARRTVVDVGPTLGGHHAALVSPLQLTPIYG